MPLTNEQAKQIKKQILQQIESTFPEDKKTSAKEQISFMNSEQLEEFLKQNNLMKNPVSENKCIFCSIVFGDAQSYEIAENEKAIAVLEINPISKGHILIIPKEHTPDYGKEPPEDAKKLIEEVSKKIKKKLKPKNIILVNTNLSGHQVINVLPVYKDENINSPRNPTKQEELQELQKILKAIPKKKIIKKPRIKKLKENLWLPKRIP